MLAVGGGCLLYALDSDGMLNAFTTSDGQLVAQRRLYPGGVQTGSARARLLHATFADQVTLSGGFLSAVWLDGLALAGDAVSECRVG
jgi:hypothetical protein